MGKKINWTKKFLRKIKKIIKINHKYGRYFNSIDFKFIFSQSFSQNY